MLSHLGTVDERWGRELTEQEPGPPPSIAGSIAAQWVVQLAEREGLLAAYEKLGGVPARLSEFAGESWVPLAEFVPLLDAAARVLGPEGLREVARRRFNEEMTTGRFSSIVRPWFKEQSPVEALGYLPRLWTATFTGAGEAKVLAKGERSIRLQVRNGPARLRTSPGVRLMYDGIGMAVLELFDLDGHVSIFERLGGLTVEIWWDGEEPDLEEHDSSIFHSSPHGGGESTTLPESTLVAGRYRVLHRLGRGGYGQVFEALDEQTGRSVAIKQLHDSFAPGSDGWKRFVREARMLGQMRHPNIVTVFDLINEPPESPMLVLELLVGVDLLTFTNQQGGALRRPATLHVARALLSALGTAHALGIVHRDVKPDNVFVAQMAAGTTRLKLLDFGLAGRYGDREDTLKGTSEQVGTPAYMAPEQVLGQKPDPRTDIYAVGATLYHLLAGRPPFDPRDHKHLVEVAKEVLRTPPTPPSRWRPSLAGAVETVLLKALAKARQDRYATSAEMLEAFEAAMR